MPAVLGKQEAKQAAQVYEKALADWRKRHDFWTTAVKLAESFHGAGSEELRLGAGEALFFQVTDAELIEDRRGAGQGRFHLAHGAPVSTTVDRGTVYITNRRIAFRGGNQKRECAFAKLTGFTHSDPRGSTTFSMSNHQQPITVKYGASLSAFFELRLQLALAHFRGQQSLLLTSCKKQLAKIDAERPSPPPAVPVDSRRAVQVGRGWATGPLLAFDTETTGYDVETDRIVTAYLGDGSATGMSWLADPGIEIPAEATAIHGVTTDEARAHGRPAAEVIGEIVGALARALAAGIPVVAYNAPFDFTLLDRECRRYGLPSLEDHLRRPVSPVVDPLVLDRHFDRRPGSRKLQDACQEYGVPLLNAHEARGDSVGTLGLARAIAARYPEVAAMTADALHRFEVGAHRDWAAHFTAFRRRHGYAHPEVDGSWPVKPLPGGDLPAQV